MKRPLFDLSDRRRVFRVLLAHATMLLSAMVLTWFIIDRFNTAMEFMEADISKWFIGALAVLSLVSSIVTIVSLWVRPKSKKRRHAEKHADDSSANGGE